MMEIDAKISVNDEKLTACNNYKSVLLIQECHRIGRLGGNWEIRRLRDGEIERLGDWETWKRRDLSRFGD